MNSPRLWLAWLLLCLLAAPAQALNGLNLPMSAFSPGSKRACTAKSFRVDFPINHVDPSGLKIVVPDNPLIQGGISDLRNSSSKFAELYDKLDSDPSYTIVLKAGDLGDIGHPGLTDVGFSDFSYLENGTVFLEKRNFSITVDFNQLYQGKWEQGTGGV